MPKKISLTAFMLATILTALPFSPPDLLAESDGTMPIVAEKPTPAPSIVAGETLSLAKVVAITRLNQPAITAAQGNVRAGESKIGQAKSAYLPQVNGKGGYDRLSPGGTIYKISDDMSYDQLDSAIDAKQLLYDFGRTSTQVEIQKTNLDSARADLNFADDLSVYNAKLAYYDILKIARNKEAAAETVKQFEQHLEQAKGFFAAGVKPKYDVTKAEVDLSRAKLLQIQVSNNLRLARVTLNNAMGLPDAPDYQLEDTLDSGKFTFPFEQALPMALDHRPDLRALILKKKAALQAVELAQKGDAPSLSAGAGVVYSGDADSMDEGWNAGVMLTVPIFNGFLTRNQIGEAKANADVLTANVVALQQTIHKEVQQSYLNLSEADERITVTRLAIQQAEENSRIASGRYRAGVGSPVEVTDADTLLIQARADHNQSLYDYRMAQIVIEQSIGRTHDSDDLTRPEK
jgi:outer membrane protein TolC